MLFLLAFIFPKPELVREIVLSSFEDTNRKRSILKAKAGKQGAFFQPLGFAPCSASGSVEM